MKINSLVWIVAIAPLACSFSTLADCTFPKAPATIPDGKSATQAEMLEAMRAFKAYNEAVAAFGACLEQETRSKSGDSARLQFKALQMKKHNAAVNELQAKAKQFNEQVRIFKAKG